MTTTSTQHSRYSRDLQYSEVPTLFHLRDLHSWSAFALKRSHEMNIRAKPMSLETSIEVTKMRSPTSIVITPKIVNKVPTLFDPCSAYCSHPSSPHIPNNVIGPTTHRHTEASPVSFSHGQGPDTTPTSHPSCCGRIALEPVRHLPGSKT